MPPKGRTGCTNRQGRGSREIPTRRGPAVGTRGGSERRDPQRAVDLLREVDDATFHHKPDLADRPDVPCRIAGDQEEVGELPPRDGAALLVDAEVLRRPERRHL